MQKILCDYDTGMFTLEPLDETEVGQFFALEIEKGKTSFHEAGHAVLGRVLTLVCDSASTHCCVISKFPPTPCLAHSP